MNPPEPPKIVFEQRELCADAIRAWELLQRTLAPSKSPGEWTVSMRLTREPGGLRGEGEITDERGAPVAHREFTNTGGAATACAPLARAVGVWASLVLDAELERAAQAPTVLVKLAARTDPNTLPPLWPAPVRNETAPPEYFGILKHAPDKRSLEVGVSTFLMGGTGTGALAGPAVYTVIEIDSGIFLRPMIAVGRTLEALKPAGDVYGTWGITRFDACLRIPGMYLARRGIQLDTCGGADLGFLHFDSQSAEPNVSKAATSARTIPYLAFGPSLGLRGELASDLSVELRGLALINVIRESFVDSNLGAHVDPPLLAGRVELGLSWRWR